MLFVIAVLSGVGSTDTLILIIVSTICCMFCGFISEATAREPGDRKLSKLSTFMGWILMLASFGVILRRFGSIVSQAQSTGSPGPPSFVWAIIIGMLILYMSFGVIHAVHMRKQWASIEPVDSAFHRRIDNAYTIVSMVSKTLLVVLVASGLFSFDRSSNDQ
jgi:sulfite exporter TauE/SafE